MKSGTTIQAAQGWHLAAIYEQHYQTLVRVAMRLLDTKTLAEEAVQEVFLRVHAGGVSPRPGSELAYLRTAVTNTARSMLRRRQCADRWRPETPRYVAAVDEVCADRETWLAMRRHCAELPARQREVLVLRYWQGLSVNETADRLSISPGSVKTHASRGRDALRRRLLAGDI